MHRVRPFARLAGVIAAAALVLALFPADLGAQTLPSDVAKAFKSRAIGPTRQSGRFVDFAVPAREPHTIYAATGSGGHNLYCCGEAKRPICRVMVCALSFSHPWVLALVVPLLIW